MLPIRIAVATQEPLYFRRSPAYVSMCWTGHGKLHPLQVACFSRIFKMTARKAPVSDRRARGAVTKTVSSTLVYVVPL